MHAITSLKPGEPDTLELTELPTPEPSAGEVRVRVHAAGVNFPDTLIIRDLYQIKPPRPFSPGGEVAGVIDAVGDAVTGFSVGDRVLALTVFGGFASHVCAPASHVTQIPSDMPFDDAACFLFTYGTSYYALHDCGELSAQDTVLVLGAAGGIGVSAVELSKAAGAHVIAAVSSKEKATFCKNLGADETIIYSRQLDRDAQKSLSSEIKAITKPNGVNIVYDAIGGDYAEPALRTIAWNGRYLVVGFTAGIPSIPLNLPLLKNCSIKGVFWGAFLQREPQRFQTHLSELFALYRAGRIKPRISARYQLQDAAKALTEIEKRTATGKIVLTVIDDQPG